MNSSIGQSLVLFKPTVIQVFSCLSSPSSLESKCHCFVFMDIKKEALKCYQIQLSVSLYVQTAQFPRTLIFNIQSQNAHVCKLRTVTSWGHATFWHCNGCSVKEKKGDLEGEEEWEEWKTGGRGEGQGATSGVGGAGGCGWVCSRTAKWTVMRHIREGSEEEGWYFSREACSARACTHKRC